VSQGIGGELRHAMQDEPVQPVIPLGSKGQLQGVDWQVVGYQHRMGHEPGDDESFGWEEYLLYNRKRGFSFLVDSAEGWSLVKPTTGSPSLGADGKIAAYLKSDYRLQYAYEAETTYVAGEFYWPVERGQKTFNRDFAKGSSLLSMEQTPKEVIWSIGGRIDSATVAAAFKISDKHGDSGPTNPKGSGGGMGCGSIVLWLIIILMLLVVIKACVDDNDGSGSGYSGRSSGGSYGGYSGGGGHK